VHVPGGGGGAQATGETGYDRRQFVSSRKPRKCVMDWIS
jgi:hypothetical protein